MDKYVMFLKHHGESEFVLIKDLFSLAYKLFHMARTTYIFHPTMLPARQLAMKSYRRQRSHTIWNHSPALLGNTSFCRRTQAACTPSQYCKL